jgi:hypothetical protein
MKKAVTNIIRAGEGRTLRKLQKITADVNTWSQSSETDYPHGKRLTLSFPKLSP